MVRVNPRETELQRVPYRGMDIHVVQADPPGLDRQNPTGSEAFPDQPVKLLRKQQV